MLTRRLLPRAALLTGVLLAVPLVAPAAAEPRPTLDQVKVQVAALNERAEASAEAYNAGRIELATANERLAVQRAAVRDARRKVDTQRVVVGKFAADAYRSGGLGGQDALTVLLTSDDPTSAMQKMATAGVLERRNSTALRDIEAARQELDQAELVAKQEADRAEGIAGSLAARQSEVQALLGQATDLLDRLTAEEKARIAAEREAERKAQEAEAARERARVAAELAAEQRAQERAAAQERRRERAAASSSRGSGGSSSGGSSSGGSSGGAKPRSVPKGASAKANAAVQAALSKLGSPYKWAAAGPNSFDCSGLIAWAYKQVGVSVPHYTGAIWTGFKRVDRSDLRPGDVILYYPDVHHAGIYIGGGKMVHAPQTGDVVKISDAFRNRQYTGAVRIVG